LRLIQLQLTLEGNHNADMVLSENEFHTGPDLPIRCIGLSLGPQDPRGRPANCGTHRVNYRHMISSTIIRQNFMP